MKVAWFTPFTQGSAVSDVSRLVTEEMNQYGIQVELFVPKHHETTLLTTSVPVHFFSGTDSLSSRLEDFDLNLFVMGNFLNNHGDIFQMLWRHKGVLLLHDMAYWDFFEQYFHKIGNPKLGLQFTAHWHADQYMQLPLLSRSYGAIVHSSTHAEQIRHHFKGSVQVQELPLLYPSDYENATPIHNRKLRLLILGSMNRNKLIEEIVQVISTSPVLTSSVELTVAGKPSDPEYAHLLHEQTKIHPWLTLKENVTLEEKQSIINAADICLNLRYPTIEGASETILEELAVGKTVIVLDIGSFRDLPATSVIKIPFDHWEEDLTHHLISLTKDTEKLTVYRKAALEYMKEHHHISTYARETAQFLQSILTKLPWLRTIDTVANEVGVLPEPAQKLLISQLADVIPYETE